MQTKLTVLFGVLDQTFGFEMKRSGTSHQNGWFSNGYFFNRTKPCKRKFNGTNVRVILQGLQRELSDFLGAL
jgi:hypothetical protein